MADLPQELIRASHPRLFGISDDPERDIVYICEKNTFELREIREDRMIMKVPLPGIDSDRFIKLVRHPGISFFPGEKTDVMATPNDMNQSFL